jgi:hypothetical protein
MVIGTGPDKVRFTLIQEIKDSNSKSLFYFEVNSGFKEQI